MNRRSFLKESCAGVAIALGAASSGAQEAKPKRNVLLYVVDDQGTNDAGCYGNPVIRTPGLDLLASAGTKMNYAFCTTPSCSPSRSVILTGRHNHTTGQYGLQHSTHHFESFATVRSLPNILGEAGYRTLNAGKFHVGPEKAYHFDERIATAAPSEMAEKCRPLIAAEDTKPFFLYFCTREPHRNFRREGSQPVDADEVLVPDYLPDTAECRAELARYYMSVERADSGLVKLIEILKESGRWEDTLIIYLSDNGIPFPGAKTNLYEPGVRLPFVVRNPLQSNEGSANDAMVSYVDVAPTILDFAGVAHAEDQFHGRSFLPILDSDEREGWDEIYMSHSFHEVTMYYPVRGVRGRRYKLLWNIAHGLEFPFASDLYRSETWQAVLARGDTHYGKRTVEAYVNRPEFELYDLVEDPDEIHNLAASSAHASVLNELKSKLRSFQERTKDPWLIKWEHE